MKNLYNFLIVFGLITLPSILMAQVTVGNTGILTIPKSGQALIVNGGEAIWANSQYYSWGYGKNWNYFADEILIGNGGGAPYTPSTSMGLTISNSRDIRLEGTGSKYLYFYEGAVAKGYVGHSGTHLIIQNDETNGMVEIDGQTEVDLRINNNSALNINSSGLVTVDRAGEAIRLNGSSSYMSFYNGATYNGYLWHNNTNMYLNNNTATGSMYLGTGAAGVDMTINPAGNVGMGTTAPADELHIVGGSSADIRLESSSSKYLRLYEGTTQKAIIGHSGTHSYMYNYETNGNMYLGTSGGADLTISATGDVGIGDTSPDAKFEVAGGLILNEGTTTQVTGASATQLVERTDGAAMLFGAGTNAGFTIDENFDFQVRSRPRANVLARSLSGGQYLFVADGNNGNSAFGYSNAAGATHRVRVNGSIQATAFAPPSDRKLKKDVNPFEIGLDAVKKINPVTYVYNGVAGINCDATQVGMMAQDLQKIAPVLVQEETYYEKDDETGKTAAKDTYLSINDTGIKYILINAIKELAADGDQKDERIKVLEAKNTTLETKNTELQDGYNALNDRLNKLEALLSNDDNTVIEKLNTEKNVVINGEGHVAELAQNQPNPFSENTTINYFLPEGTTGAEMNIFSIEGKLLKSVKIDEAGSGQINLKANSLPAGTYSYQLITDTGIVGSKSMVLIK